MINLKLHIGKKNSRFIHDYIRVGLAETEQETIRHALLLFFWNSPDLSPNKQAAEMSDAEMKKKMTMFCEAIVTAYRMACTRRGMLKGAKH